MPRLKPEVWQSARAEYEAGATQGQVAVKYKVARSAVQKRILKEGWIQDPEPTIRRKVAEKVAGMVAASDPKKNAAAMDAEVERRVEVLRKHREEWNAIRSLAYNALTIFKSAATREQKITAAETMKLAKVGCDTFTAMQAGERKAWGLDEKPDPAVTLIAQLFQGRIDIKALTIEELREIRGKVE